MNDVQIANWLNENEHQTPRGNTFIKTMFRLIKNVPSIGSSQV